MHADRRGVLWLGTDQGLSQYRGRFGSVTGASVTDEVRRIRGLSTSSDGALWIYDLDRGLLRWDGRRLEAVALPADLQRGLICDLHVDRTDRIWIGFRQQGVALVGADGGTAVFTAAHGLQAGMCNAIRDDAQGHVWVLGARGLGRYVDGSFVTVQRPGDLPLDNLTGMAEDRGGAIWVSSLSSITRLAATELDDAFAGRWDKVHARVYDASSGIAGAAPRAGRSIVRAGDGSIWALTSRGVTTISAERSDDLPAPAAVHIDSVILDGRDATAALPPTLSPGLRRVEIDFSSPDLRPGRRLRLHYRLDGFDTEWRPVAPSQRRVVYTNLAPGDYRFRLENIAPAGVSASSAEWGFTIEPAFYQTTWFAALGLVAVATTGSWLWRRRIAQVRREFTILLKERVRLSREIHDTLLQSLIGVSLRLEHVEHDVSTSPQGTATLVRMRREVEQYIREARESIWNLRSSALEQGGLAAALRRVGERAVGDRPSGQTAPAISFTVSGAASQCAPEVEEQLLRIGQEAVTNATRHGRATEVRVDLEYRESGVALRIADNGEGFDLGRVAETGGQHWGLQNMRERAAAAGGALLIDTSPGSGTRIEVTLPRSLVPQ
jgi:signal transduction histidine kinase